MPKYLISWEETQWMDLIIDAPSESMALDMFHDRAYDIEHVAIVGQEMIPDTIEVEEI